MLRPKALPASFQQTFPVPRAAAPDLSSFWGSLDFFEKLQDLGWGSWEVLLPEGSNLGGDSHSSPMRLSDPTPRLTQHCPELYQSSFNIADWFIRRSRSRRSPRLGTDPTATP